MFDLSWSVIRAELKVFADQLFGFIVTQQQQQKLLIKVHLLHLTFVLFYQV